MSMGVDEFPGISLAGWMKAHKTAGLWIGWLCVIVGLLSGALVIALMLPVVHAPTTPNLRVAGAAGMAFWATLCFGLALFGGNTLWILYSVTPEQIEVCKEARKQHQEDKKKRSI